MLMRSPTIFPYYRGAAHLSSADRQKPHWRGALGIDSVRRREESDRSDQVLVAELEPRS